MQTPFYMGLGGGRTLKKRRIGKVTEVGLIRNKGSIRRCFEIGLTQNFLVKEGRRNIIKRLLD